MVSQLPAPDCFVGRSGVGNDQRLSKVSLRVNAHLSQEYLRNTGPY